MATVSNIAIWPLNVYNTDRIYESCQRLRKATLGALLKGDTSSLSDLLSSLLSAVGEAQSLKDGPAAFWWTRQGLARELKLRETCDRWIVHAEARSAGETGKVSVNLICELSGEKVVEELSEPFRVHVQAKVDVDPEVLEAWRRDRTSRGSHNVVFVDNGSDAGKSSLDRESSIKVLADRQGSAMSYMTEGVLENGRSVRVVPLPGDGSVEACWGFSQSEAFKDLLGGLHKQGKTFLRAEDLGEFLDSYAGSGAPDAFWVRPQSHHGSRHQVVRESIHEVPQASERSIVGTIAATFVDYLENQTSGPRESPQTDFGEKVFVSVGSLLDTFNSMWGYDADSLGNTGPDPIDMSPLTVSSASHSTAVDRPTLPHSRDNSFERAA